MLSRSLHKGHWQCIVPSTSVLDRSFSIHFYYFNLYTCFLMYASSRLLILFLWSLWDCQQTVLVRSYPQEYPTEVYIAVLPMVRLLSFTLYRKVLCQKLSYCSVDFTTEPQTVLWLIECRAHKPKLILLYLCKNTDNMCTVVWCAQNCWTDNFHKSFCVKIIVKVLMIWLICSFCRPEDTSVFA